MLETGIPVSTWEHEDPHVVELTLRRVAEIREERAREQ